METPNQEWERHIEQKDWETLGITPEENEVIDNLMEKTKVCYYCRSEVEADYGQTQVYCNHCQTISLAVNPT